MSTAGLFVLFGLTVGVLIFIAWPLMTRVDSANSADTDTSPDAPINAVAGLRRDYTATLVTLRDLDFDFQTGKLTAADYQAQREALIARGAELLWQIDSINSQ